MAVYTVYQPPLPEGQSAPNPEQFVFVRDAFAWLAFFLAPLWMLWHRLWLALVIYLVVVAGLVVALRTIIGPGLLSAVVMFVIALLVGFEANSLRRWTLERRRWKNIGVVVGDDLESAERRFFDGWEERAPAAAPQPQTQPPLPMPPHPSPDEPHIIGLFPEPGAPR
jgi:hypothetical protein